MGVGVAQCQEQTLGGTSHLITDVTVGIAPCEDCSMSDDLLFIDDEPVVGSPQALASWQVMIVDDEPAVHEVTRLVMSGFTFDGKGLSFIDCYITAMFGLFYGLASRAKHLKSK